MKKVFLPGFILSLFCTAVSAAEDAGSAISTLIDKGDSYVNEDKYDAAIAAYKAAVKASPSNSQAHERLARALGFNGDIKEAIDEDQNALQIDPRNALAHSHLGWACGVEGMYHQAVVEAKAAIQLDPANASPYLTLGLAQTSLGNYDQAIIADQKAIELDPGNLKAYVNLAATLGRKGDYAEAAQIYRQAIELNPKSVSAHLGLGAALGKMGQIGPQVDEFLTAVTLAPYSDNAHGKLGWALYNQGNWQGAFSEGFITNCLRLSKTGPQFLNKVLSIWGGIFLLFGLIFAVVFFGARFKPEAGETVGQSYFLIFYKDKPGRFVITSKRLVFIPEWFSSWFGCQPVLIDSSTVKDIHPRTDGKTGMVIELSDGTTFDFTMPNLVAKPLLQNLTAAMHH